jgi:hypothetical protein
VPDVLSCDTAAAATVEARRRLNAVVGLPSPEEAPEAAHAPA